MAGAVLRAFFEQACLAVVLAALGCAPQAPPEQTATAELPVTNGTFDPGDPAVIALTNGQHITCSGTLITSTVVVTAAHCVPPHTPYHATYTDIQIFFGSTFPGGQGELVPVIEGWTHPGWNIEVYENDIALLRLAHPVSVQPKPFHPSALSFSDLQHTVRVIGFGATTAQNPGSVGNKYEGTTSIDEIFTYVFTTVPSPSMTCGGDSGGPTFLTRDGSEVLVGVHSRADENCIELSIETAVGDYIDEILAFTGEPLPAICGSDAQCAEGCTSVDPDCPCALDGFCTDACTTPDDDPDCTCGADGMCSLACASDPDCNCSADGTCNASCESDPDCVADGKCDAASKNDADCWTAGNLEPQVYEPATGCSIAPSKRREAFGWLALLALVAVKRRRRVSHSVERPVEKLQRI